jgi:hypothetical protein
MAQAILRLSVAVRLGVAVLHELNASERKENDIITPLSLPLRRLKAWTDNFHPSAGTDSSL